MEWFKEKLLFMTII